MPILIAPPAGLQVLCEMQELAQIPAAAQRYIRRSLDVASKCWERLSEISRTESEAKSIDQQIELYGRLDSIRAAIPSNDDQFAVAHFTSLAAEIASFDLSQQKMRSFLSFRFLYERLLGAAARPWLLTIFAMSATMAPISAALRSELLKSIGDQSINGQHSILEPRFVPEWVDRVDG